MLRTGLVGGVLVGCGSVGLALQKTAPRSSVAPLKVLDATEYTVLVALAERLCPPLGQDRPGATALGVAQTLDDIVAQADPESQKGFKIALRIFENGLTGALMGERLRPFTKLSPADQDRVLAGWRDSSVGFRRTVFRALSGNVWAAYWGDERTWPRIGYGGPPDVADLRSAYAENLVELDALRATHAAKEI